MKTPIVFKVDDSFYHNTIFFICDCAHDKITDALHPDFQMEGLSATVRDSGKFFPLESKEDKGVTGYLIWLEKRPRSIEQRCFGHEIEHLVIHAFGDSGLGIPINHDTSEAFTYYVDYITANIIRQLKKAVAEQKKPKKVKK